MFQHSKHYKFDSPKNTLADLVKFVEEVEGQMPDQDELVGLVGKWWTGSSSFLSYILYRWEMLKRAKVLGMWLMIVNQHVLYFCHDKICRSQLLIEGLEHCQVACVRGSSFWIWRFTDSTEAAIDQDDRRCSAHRKKMSWENWEGIDQIFWRATKQCSADWCHMCLFFKIFMILWIYIIVDFYRLVSNINDMLC